MDIGSLLSYIALGLAGLYAVMVMVRLSRFFGAKARLLRGVQDLSCVCEEGLITAVNFFGLRLIELAGEEMFRVGHVEPGERIMALHADITRMQAAIEKHLEGIDGADVVRDCADAADALKGWLHTAYTLKPDWKLILIPSLQARKSS